MVTWINYLILSLFGLSALIFIGLDVAERRRKKRKGIEIRELLSFWRLMFLMMFLLLVSFSVVLL